MNLVGQTTPATAAPPAPARGAPLTIHRAPAPLTIDADLQKPVWQQAVAARVDYVQGLAGVVSELPRMLVKFAWDEHYLYVAYETFDRHLCALGNDHMQGPPNNRRPSAAIWHPGVAVNVVEFFISLGSRRHFWELHHNCLNQFNDVMISVVDRDDPWAASEPGRHALVFGDHEALPDDGPYTMAMATRLKPRADGSPALVNGGSGNDTGYFGELRLPWRGLGAPLSAAERDPRDPQHGPLRWNLGGHRLQVMTVIQIAEAPNRYFHSSPTFPGGWFHHAWEQWPVYVLGE